MKLPTLFAREDFLNKLTYAFMALKFYVDAQSSLHFFNINILSENFFAVLLSEVYGMSLVNLNVVSKTYPAIDLGDRARRVSIQITSNRTKKKVQETIDKFCEHKLHNDFDRVLVIIIGERRGKYPGLKRQSPVKFDPDTDVKGISELLNEINQLDTSKLTKLCEIIDREMPVMKAFIGNARPTDFDALKEYRAQFDRSALQDSLIGCGNYKKFSEALDELIGLLNTGVVRGQNVTKRRMDFDNEEWGNSLENLYHRIRQLRQLYVALVRSKEIDEGACRCKFREHSMYGVFEKRKEEIITELNLILHRADLPSIRSVS